MTELPNDALSRAMPGLAVSEQPYVHVSETAMQRGYLLEHAANGASLLRFAGGLAVVKRIESTPNYQSWELAMTFGALALTDLADGYLSRKGRQIRHADESVRRPLRSFVDKLPDKVLVDGVMKAIAAQEQRTGNSLYGKVVDAEADVTIARDILSTADDVVATLQNIDPRAQSGGKRKTVMQYMAVGFALTPLAKSPAGKTAAAAAMAYTTKESLTSGFANHMSYFEQRRERKDAEEGLKQHRLAIARGEIRPLYPSDEA